MTAMGERANRDTIRAGHRRALKRPATWNRTAFFPQAPRSLIEDCPGRWSDVAWGRWNWKDHITVGEGRAAVEWLEFTSRVARFEFISQVARFHCYRVYSLEEDLS